MTLDLLIAFFIGAFFGCAIWDSLVTRGWRKLVRDWEALGDLMCSYPTSEERRRLADD